MRDQVAREFLMEADALAEALFDDVESLRLRYRNGHARRELVDKIFRRVHSIKGTASAAEVESVAIIAHNLESLLDGARRGKISVDERLINAVEDGATAISQSLAAAANGNEEIRQPDLIEDLDALANSIPTSSIDISPALKKVLTSKLNTTLNEHHSYRLQEAIEEGARLFIINAEFDIASFDVFFRRISEVLANSGDLITSEPGVEPAQVERIGFSILYAAPLSKDEVRALTSFLPGTTVTEIDTSDTQISDTNPERDFRVDTAQDSEEPALTDSPTSSVRIRLTELDEIISSSDELLRHIKVVLDLASGSMSSVSDTHAEKIKSGSQLVRSRFLELEERLIGLRLVRSEQLLERARRAGRIAARATGKLIDFEVLGGGVRLDKFVEETVLTSLMHLVRNAVDHGIESPSERQLLGKSSRGKVRIEALAEGTRVRFRVADDGRGITPEQVASAAIEHGLMKPGTPISMEQSLRLIFHPGFSTALGVSNISGRGVGLDVVERAVEQAGGEIKVFSEAGIGTSFDILMSPPLAIVPSIVLLSNKQQYCIDKSLVEAVTAIEVLPVGGEPLEWQGEKLPFVEIEKLLGQTVEETPVASKRKAIIVSVEHSGVHKTEHQLKRCAISVESIAGSHEALVRSLGRHSSRWIGISGATELPDGSIALLLDISTLLTDLAK